MEKDPQKMLFFSIIIPAHNEEKYLGATLEHARALDYPKDRFEVIVVENGSTDRTLEIARSFRSETMHTLQSEKGVSRAKNAGIAHTRQESEWIIFLDADTILGRAFLSELNDYLKKRRDKNLAIGTAAVRPLEERGLYAASWFAFHNLVHRLTHSSFAIQIMGASLREKIRFDERLHFGEDLNLIRDARRFGRFFFFQTDQVATSIRRFEKLGWARLMIEWIFDWLVLSKLKKKREGEYQVIR